MSARPALAAVLALALSACASAHWSKPGADSAQVAADLSDCSALAAQPDTRNSAIESDIMASRGADWQKSGTLSQHQADFAADARDRANDIVNTCMGAKGYSQAK